MKRYYFIGIAVILVLALALVGYGAWLNFSDENQIARRMEERALQLTGAKAQKRALRPAMALDTVRLYSEKMTDAVALTDGRITRWAVGKNTPVRAGDLLLTMSNEQIPARIQQAASGVRRAEAVLAQAVNSYHRQERLLARRATSQEKYEEAEAQYLAASEALTEAQAQHEQLLIMQDWLNVHSPVDGDVLIVYQHEGAYVQAGMPVALVGDFSKLQFNTTLGDADTRYLSLGTKAVLRFQDATTLEKAYGTGYAAGNHGANPEVRATLVDIQPPPGQPADIRRAVWEIDNRSRIFEPMTYTGVTLETELPHTCLTVPRLALLDSKMDTVFVVDTDGIVHRRTVTAGASDAQSVEIVSGLSEGEVVAVGRLDGLAEGQRVDIVMQKGEEG